MKEKSMRVFYGNKNRGNERLMNVLLYKIHQSIGAGILCNEELPLIILLKIFSGSFLAWFYDR
jgi:hypothetical protein